VKKSPYGDGDSREDGDARKTLARVRSLREGGRLRRSSERGLRWRTRGREGGARGDCGSVAAAAARRQQARTLKGLDG
jgi:hypothetical protein